MCDSVVVARPGEPVWLAKNSDREPDEPQLVEVVAAAEHPPGAILRGTSATLPQVRRTRAMIVSRPAWMAGIEMGVNERGVAVANQAVWTRVPVAPRGLTSMDLQRLALERSDTAADAVEVVLDLLARFPQGGRMALGDPKFQYHGAMILADPAEAWILETAGEFWALQRVRGVRSISNALTIRGDFDRVHPGAYAYARSRGLCRSALGFDFAAAFASPTIGALAGARARRRCSAGLAGILQQSERLGLPGLALVLRDHDGATPAAGLRMRMPCAHASYLPTRTHGQTTGSMIARLAEGSPARVWLTGTSSPCLSIFKPASLDLPAGVIGPAPTTRADGESLWWQHDGSTGRRSSTTRPARPRSPTRGRSSRPGRPRSTGDVAAVAEIWEAHRQALPGWAELASAVGRPGRRPFARWWAHKAKSAAATS
ncbi:MAG: hypothetical protein R3B09_18710 [Nannocystaceae bacterium]